MIIFLFNCIFTFTTLVNVVLQHIVWVETTVDIEDYICWNNRFIKTRRTETLVHFIGTTTPFCRYVNSGSSDIYEPWEALV